MATKTWKGFLQFGMVSIPVYLNIGARGDTSLSMNMLHKEDNGQVKMPRSCSVCEKKLASEDIVKGYKTGDGSYVLVTAEELEAIEPESSRVMEINQFVDAKEVDAIYLAESFYLLPEKEGLKPYTLIVKALLTTNRVAIARLTKNNREHVVLLRPRGKVLIAHFLWYADEVQVNPEAESLVTPMITAAEADLAKRLIDNMTEPFDIKQYKDGYRDRFRQLIASKLDSTVQAPVSIKSVEPAKQDLMAALEASLLRPKRSITLQEEPTPIAKAPEKKRKTA